MARPSSYDESKLETAKDYLENYKEHGDEVPQVAGLAKACEVCEKTIYNWGDAYPEFLQTLDAIQSEQHRVLVNKGLTGDFSAPITKLMLHNHGHKEKTESDVTSGGKPLNNFTVQPVTTHGGNQPTDN